MKLKTLLLAGSIIVAGIAVGFGVRMALAPSQAAAPVAAYQVGQTLPLATTAAPSAHFQDIAWEALIPKSWDAMQPFKGMQLDKLGDEDPRAMQALEDAKAYWEKAPVEPKVDGMQVRIPGFVVSLEREGDALNEFLLVPYFGACIHIPPPPANQIIHAHSARAIPGVRTMDPVWISGTLKVDRSDTLMGSAGYSMAVAKLEPYVEPPDATVR